MAITKLNISIDDVNPKKSWRILGEPTEKYLEKLYDDYGALTTLFVPSNHHGNADISDNEEWIHELDSLPFIELAAHGHFHNASEPWGECEFGELQDPKAISDRLGLINRAWDSVGYYPRIWKSPGWLTSRASAERISNWFDMAVVHPHHNNNLKWGIPTINATDYFPPNNFPVGQDVNIFILSHIYGRHDNTWNENFYNWVCQVLNQLKESTQLEYCFIKEF